MYDHIQHDEAGAALLYASLYQDMHTRLWILDIGYAGQLLAAADYMHADSQAFTLRRNAFAALHEELRKCYRIRAC